MRITPNEYLKNELLRLGKKSAAEGFSVHEEDYFYFLEEVEKLHPQYTAEQKQAWAAYSALTHPSDKLLPPDVPQIVTVVVSKSYKWILVWAIAATVLDIGLIIVRLW